MKAYRRLMVLAGALLLAAGEANSQIYYDSMAQYEKSGTAGKRMPIDWSTAAPGTNRYTLALRPLYFANNGIKLDFEMELPRPGTWLQIDAVCRFTTYDEHVRGYWEAGSNWFTKTSGAGVGVYYKSFFRPNGWYYDIGLMVNYYGVSKPGMVGETFVEDGLEFVRYDRQMIHWNFVKPALNFNVGKHFALTNQLFLDAFIGLGYAYSIHPDETYLYFNSYDPRGFTYRGIYMSAGFRIGILWSRSGR